MATTGIWAALKRAGGAVRRVCTPSETAWSAASLALLAFWAFLFLSFLVATVAPTFS